MAFQMRATAFLRSVNLWTGFAPGRLFQISASRAAGQSAANLASPASVLKRCAAGTASACFAVACTVMLFVPVSIVNIFMVLSLRGSYRGDHIHASVGQNKQGNSTWHSAGAQKAMRTGAWLPQRTDPKCRPRRISGRVSRPFETGHDLLKHPPLLVPPNLVHNRP